MSTYIQTKCIKVAKLGVSSLGDKKFLFRPTYHTPKILTTCLVRMYLIAVIVFIIIIIVGGGLLASLPTY